MIRKHLKGFLRKFGSFKRLEAVSSKKVSNAKKLELFWKKADVKLVWQIVNSEEFQDSKEMRNDETRQEPIDLAKLRNRVNALKRKASTPRADIYDLPITIFDRVEQIQNLEDLLEFFEK